MIARVLSLIGSLSLLAIASVAGWWALNVVQAQPPLPPLATLDTAAPDSAPGATRRATTRPKRPDVYYQAVAQRPVFAPDRRPVALAPDTAPAPAPEPTAAPQIAPPPEPPQVKLLGVMGNESGLRALVSRPGADPIWLTTTDQLDGWTITTIAPDALELSHDTQTIRIEMYQ